MNKTKTNQKKSNLLSDKPLGDLPRWNLSDLYNSTKSEQFKQDLAEVTTGAKLLKEKYQGKISELDANSLAKLIKSYEQISELIGRIGSFAFLNYAENVSNSHNAQFFQNIQEKITDISSDILFVTLEINRLEEDVFVSLLENDNLAYYEPWLRDIRAERKYQLSDDLERLINEKRLTSQAWVRLFDESISRLRFLVNGTELTSADALNLLSDSKKENRKAAAEEIGFVFGKNIETFSLITNTLAKDKEIEDKWRGFSAPISARNLSNRIEDTVVETLLESVTKSYSSIPHRYYALKAKWMNVEKLNYWDRNAPLPDDDVKLIPWEDAVKIVIDSYKQFSPALAEVGKRFFDNPWIDAPPLEGKSPGAFAHPTVPSVHPYLLLNYQGKTRDVMTLAHELGHGVHQVLASGQGQLMSDTPLTLAETASVFGEQLTFQSMLSSVSDSKQRRILLSSKVEDMLNTVFRQVAFCDFEKIIHHERRKGELTSERICDIWLDVQSKCLGPAINISGDYKYFWAYIPHFIHSPFYVYAYAFGDCLVNALYGQYKESPEGFEPLYLDMLRAGGTLPHASLLAPFGLDATSNEFWDKGLGIIEGYINELTDL
tara:strand:- start:9042 stop:10850 length:1809 start_codon:yes stop_codon:yes gene_type:complete